MTRGTVSDRPSRIRSAVAFARFLAEVRRLVRNPVSLDDAKRGLQEALANREANFLTVLERAVSAHRPYRWLMERADCEFGDVATSVRQKGLEPTLSDLYDAGVYVAFEEFKGRAPMVRDGRELEVTAEEFNVSAERGSFGGSSSGSSGRPTSFRLTAAQRRHESVVRVCTDEVMGFRQFPFALWRESFPSPVGVIAAIRSVVCGSPTERWFAPGTERSIVKRTRSRLATEMILCAMRLGGAKVPSPRRLSEQDAIEIVRWAADRVETHGGSVISTPTSRAVRLSTIAREHGISLDGVTMTITSEPVTEAKFNEIARSGARAIPYYHLEGGTVGIGCTRPASVNDLHFCRHAFAMITRPRATLSGGPSVDVFHLTTLTTDLPKIMINVDSDDYGVFETRSCGCPVEALGLTEHVSDIYCFSKLTGEGVTLAGTEAVRILEDVLPARFGGTPLDYQLHEEEVDGATKLSLVVSPRVHITDEEEVVRVFLEGLGPRGLGADVRNIWQSAGTVRLKRAEPIMSERGKLFPLVRTTERTDR